jgi:hypothetical protein
MDTIVRGSVRPSLVVKIHPSHAYQLRRLLRMIKGVVLPKLLNKLPSLADMIFTKHNRPGYASIRLFAGIYSDPREREINLKSWFCLQPVERPEGGSIVSCWAENGDHLIPIEAPSIQPIIIIRNQNNLPHGHKVQGLDIEVGALLPIQ